jgi:hypothetical protein
MKIRAKSITYVDCLQFLTVFTAGQAKEAADVERSSWSQRKLKAGGWAAKRVAELFCGFAVKNRSQNLFWRFF